MGRGILHEIGRCLGAPKLVESRPNAFLFSLACPVCTGPGWGGRRSCLGQALICSLVDFPDVCLGGPWASTKLESACGIVAKFFHDLPWVRRIRTRRTTLVLRITTDLSDYPLHEVLGKRIGGLPQTICEHLPW